MKYRRTAAALLALAAGLGTAAVSTTAAAAPVPTSGQAAAGAHTVRTVELPTGDQVRVTQDATGTHVTAAPGAGATAGAHYTVVTSPADTYVVPGSARAGVGVTLDPALFDVTAPVMAAGSANVTVTFRPGATPHAIPGIRTTSVSGNELYGVITNGSARTFGAAVGQPALADVSKVAPATPTTGPVTPAFVMNTLTVDVTPPAACTSCAPAIVSVINVDDAHRYSRIIFGVTGPFSISVPKGHYSVLANAFGATTSQAAQWMAVDPQFGVNRDSTVHLDLGTATQPVGVTTPMPATQVGGSDNLRRTAANGLATSMGMINATGAPFTDFVAPTTKAPTIGTLDYDFATRVAGPADAAHPYVYDLDFAGLGKIPANHQFVVSRAGLATVHESFGAAGAVSECPVAGHPWGLPGGAACPGIATTPAAIDEFVTADPRVEWTDSATANAIVITPTVVVGGDDGENLNQAYRTFTPGEQIGRRWFGHPEAPNLLAGAGQVAGTAGSLSFDHTTCAICATGSTLDLSLDPRGTTDTFGPLDPGDSANYRVLADGAVVRSGDVSAAGGQVDTTIAMPAMAHTYQIDYEVTRDPTANPLSTSSQTSWQFPAWDRFALPDGWACTQAGDTGCSVVPALDAVPDLNTSATGALAPGTDTGSLRVTQLGGGIVTVRSVEVRVSYDGGKTWQAVLVTPAGNGRYTLRLTVPAKPGGFGDLQVTAKAAAGVTFTQTIDNAFTVSAS